MKIINERVRISQKEMKIYKSSLKNNQVLFYISILN